MITSGPAQSGSLRSLPPLTWAMVVIGFIYLLSALTLGRPLTTLIAGVAPFVFAALVTFIRPIDQRFTYAAVLIGVGRGMTVMALLIFGQGVVTGDVVRMLLNVVGFLDLPVTLAGIALLGLALGRVRSRLGLGIVAVGIVVAAVMVVWYVGYLGTPGGAVTAIEAATGITFGALHPILWAYVVAAAFETRRRWLLLGALTLLVLEAILIGASLASLGPAADFSAILLVVDVLQAFGWLLLAAGALTGEIPSHRAMRRVRSA